MYLRDPFDLEGKHWMKDCQGRFCLLFVSWWGASDHVALVRAIKSEQ